MLDFDNFKINCSQLGSLMGAAKDNKRPTEIEIKKLFNTLGRDYGELSEAMKQTAHEIMMKQINYDPRRPSDKIMTELILIYTYEMYGKTKISKGNDSPHAAEKGNMAEIDSIKFLSEIDGQDYSKNDELFSNKWIKGIPDVLVKENSKIVKIIEIKTSYDLPSFIMASRKPEKVSNVYEVVGYMDILGCKDAEIVHCLVDMPEKIMSFEEKRLRERYTHLEIDPDTADDRIEKALLNMEYSDIPKELKIFRRPVTVNRLLIKDMKARATLAKRWMRSIHDDFTKKLIALPETGEE